MVKFEEMLAAYGPEKKNESPFSQMLVDAGQTRALVPLDRNEALDNMRSGFEWHNNMIRLVASCVREGLTLTETLDVMKDVTLPGYNAHETVDEISTAYGGAKRKGYDRAGIRAPEGLKTPPKKYSYKRKNTNYKKSIRNYFRRNLIISFIIYFLIISVIVR